MIPHASNAAVSNRLREDRPVNFVNSHLGRHAHEITILAAALTLLVVGRNVLGDSEFPRSFRFRVGEWVENVVDIFVDSYGVIYEPIAGALSAALEQMMALLERLPAPTIAVIIVAIVYAVAGLGLAGLTTVALLWVIAVGVWPETLETIAFMVVAVTVSVCIGIPVGVMASSSNRLDAVTRLMLDALQSFPYFAYLVVIVVIFGPGDAAALIVTIIWAFAPVARMTSVGIRGVPAEIVEAAVSAGATRWQILWKIKLPLAAPSVWSGLNQTILYAISMATISALIGGSGLGQPVWGGLGRLEFGQALEPGIALVLIAVILDRVSQKSGRTVAAAGQTARTSLQRVLFARSGHRWKVALAIAGPFTVLAGIVPTLAFADFSNPPSFLTISLRDPVGNFVDSLNTKIGSVLDTFNSVVQTLGLNPIVGTLSWIPWPVTVVLGFLVGYLAGGMLRGLLVASCIFTIGTLGMWTAAIHTIAVVGVAVTISVVIGFPIGVLMSRSDRVATFLRPILDVIQTLPIFLFVLPTVILLGAGPVAGTLATVAYALPPVIRFTNTALRDTDSGVIEAATSSGATEGQILFGVRIPLALPTITVGINQTVLLALAMAVVSAFIGTPGLGEEVLAGVTQAQLSRGVEAGLAMFLLNLIVNVLFLGIIKQFDNRSTLKSHGRKMSIQWRRRKPCAEYAS